MRNLFILNGFIPMIVAESLMRAEYAGDENIVILEDITPNFANIMANRAKTSVVLPGDKLAAPGQEYFFAKHLFARLIPASQFLSCAYPTDYPNFMKWPLAYIREAAVTMNTGVDLRRQVGPLKFDRLLYSGNARLQYALADLAGERIKLEHGLGDYMYLRDARPTRLHTRLRRTFVRILTGFNEFQPDTVLLADGGRCVSCGTASIAGARVLRMPVPDLASQFARFLDLLATERPEVAAEVQRLREVAAGFDRIYFYLPLDRVPPADYPQILDKQLSALDTDNAVFFVKPHPTDPTDYRGLFEQRGLRAYGPESTMARYLPAELYAYLFPAAILVGSGSSALFYCHWWLGSTIRYLSGGAELKWPLYRSVEEQFTADIACF